MAGIASFEKVGIEQFYKGMSENGFCSSPEEAEAVLKALSLPKRATAGSAGYDFFSTVDFELAPGETITVPTGVRVKMCSSWVLCIFPRSGLGFKYRMQLNNTVGIIDSDYYFSDNEGHIFIKITNDSKDGRVLSVKQGDGFAQGIFLQYGLTEDDNAVGIRNGGFGSTDR